MAWVRAHHHWRPSISTAVAPSTGMADKARDNLISHGVNGVSYVFMLLGWWNGGHAGKPQGAACDDDSTVKALYSVALFASWMGSLMVSCGYKDGAWGEYGGLDGRTTEANKLRNTGFGVHILGALLSILAAYVAGAIGGSGSGSGSGSNSTAM